MSKKLCLLAALIVTVCPAVVSGQIVVDFTTGSANRNAGVENGFDGLANNGTVQLDKVSRNGDVAYNLDNSRYGSDYDSVFTVKGLEYATGVGLAAGDQLNVGTNGIGVGGSSAADLQNPDNNAFNFEGGVGDRLTFNLSVEGHPDGLIVLDKFEFNDLGNREFFTLQSSGFVGKSFTGFGTGVSFDSSSGTFTFTGAEDIDGNANGGEGDGTYLLTDSSDLTIGQSIYVSEFDDLTLAFGQIDPTSTGGIPNAAFLRGFTFHAVPEPASMGLLAASGIGFVVYRRRKKKLNTKASA